MSLYPPGHRPFVAQQQLFRDDSLAQSLEAIGQHEDLDGCLDIAWVHAGLARMNLEELRALLFRTEAILEANPSCHMDNLESRLPAMVKGLLESIDAARKCLEE